MTRQMTATEVKAKILALLDDVEAGDWYLAELRDVGVLVPLVVLLLPRLVRRF